MVITPLISASAAPAEAVHARIEGFKQLGVAYKGVNDAIRAGDLAQIRTGVAQMKRAGVSIYQWFPAGSGPQSGVKTATKPEAWTNSQQFRQAQDAFAGALVPLERAATSGDLDAVRSASRSVGATCKGCHDSFRVPNS
jgi:cytochrome c556